MGTFNYVAPEIIKNRLYGTKVDMWSAGVVLYLMLSGKQPFADAGKNGRNVAETYKQIKQANPDLTSWRWVSVSDAGL